MRNVFHFSALVATVAALPFAAFAEGITNRTIGYVLTNIWVVERSDELPPPAAIRARDAEAILMPAVAPYATDAKITVPAGIPTYGFSPYLLDPKERFMERFHGVDERVSQEALAWGVEVLYDVTMGYAGE